MASAAVKRFEAKLDKSGDCWVWTGFTHKGYGRFYAGGLGWRAHRFAYAQYVGPIGGRCVLHTCDNPPCCNPSHLFLGTPLDNALDRAAKGRSGKEKRSCEKGGGAKLTVSAVKQIRLSKEPLGELAKRYGVSKQNIHAVRHGKTWVGV